MRGGKCRLTRVNTRGEQSERTRREADCAVCRAEQQRAYEAALLNSVHDAIISTDRDQVIVSWNHAAEALYGWTALEAIGQQLDVLLDTRCGNGAPRTCLERLDAEGHWEGEVVQRRRDGSLVHVLSSLSVMNLPDATRVGVVAVNRDLTHSKQLEREIHHSRRMEAVGRLASGIAHDFNNILMGIIGCCHLAEGQLDAREPARDYVSEIGYAAERGVSLVRQLLAFGRQRAKPPVSLRLDPLLEGLRTMLERLLGEDVRLVTSLRARGTVLADAGQLEQIVMNLAVNAREAMPGGGTLEIATQDVELSADDAATHLDLTRGRYVMVRVADTGVGMASDVVERAFEPFFTTKGIDGTGLGLSTVYALVRQLDGHVEVDSRLGVGTTFTILLPHHGEVGADPLPRFVPGPHEVDAPATLPAAPGEPPVATPEPARREMVLVVEDDSLVRMTVRFYLEDAGYEVIDASEPSEALALPDAQLEQVAVVLTDMVMPGMSGREMMRQLERRRPSLRAIYMSAYPGDMLVHEGRLEAGLPTLQKPFTEESLAQALRQTLDC
ncbi:MAG: PAS domain S-box protein [Deltaproteobacteria bacterium]|nr:MAG: PAS domain S-box protein [Deltaproteobacteria bacterium]